MGGSRVTTYVNLAATTRLLLSIHRFSPLECHVGRVSARRLSLEAGFDLTGHEQKGFLNIDRSFGWCFNEIDSKRCRKFLPQNDIKVDEGNITLLENRIDNYDKINLQQRTFPCSKLTALWLVRSFLFPTSNLFTLSDAYLKTSQKQIKVSGIRDQYIIEPISNLSISWSHCLMLLKLSKSVTSYTTMIPWAPR